MSSSAPPSSSWFSRLYQRFQSVLQRFAARRHWQRGSVFALLLFTLLAGPNGALTAMATLLPPSQPKPQRPRR